MGVDAPGARGGRGGSSAAADAGRRPHRPHAGAHLHAPGRFADVVSSNEQAVKADEDYIAQCKAQGLYPLGYYPHNIHFIWMGASAAGRSQLALDSARKVASVIPADALKDVPALQGFVVVPYWAMVRFAQWSDILADKGPTVSVAVHARRVDVRAGHGAQRNRTARGGREGARRS